MRSKYRKPFAVASAQSVQVHIWCSARLRLLLALASRRSKQTLSAFIRQAVWDRIRATLPSQTIERIDQEQNR